MDEDRNRMLWNLLLQKARASDVRKSSPDFESDGVVEVVMDPGANTTPERNQSVASEPPQSS